MVNHAAGRAESCHCTQKYVAALVRRCPLLIGEVKMRWLWEPLGMMEGCNNGQRSGVETGASSQRAMCEVKVFILTFGVCVCLNPFF